MESTDEKSDAEKTRLSPAEAFTAFLADLREVIDTVRRTGNDGEIQITFKFELLDAEGYGQVVVTDRTKTKKPRHSHGQTAYIITADGAVAVVPPEQMTMKGVN